MEEKPSDIIVLRGAPGSGKSQTAKCLSRLFSSVFGLFTTDDELERRLELRQNGEFKDVATCKKLNSDVLRIKCDTELQIDTTGLSPTQTARKIYESLFVGEQS